MGPGQNHQDDTVAALDFGSAQSFYSLFHKGSLVLVRKFDFGTNAVIDKVTQSLGVDRTTAEGILADGSFDISQPMSEVMGPFIKQLIISRDFVERRENTSVKNVYICGAADLGSAWNRQLASTMAVDLQAWNPLEGITIAPDAGDPAKLEQVSRFASAAGAAIGVFDES